uniref:Uncharacterized protein n=1 Tax=Heliothis virescens TaxID=7102 RepID=A0A2A4IYG2_HELVI
MSFLDLYKDEKLAKAINDLGDVEVFRENLDIDGGPKHGGNYRKATKEDLRLLKPTESRTDAETSQSKNTKHVELEDYRPTKLHGGNLKSLSDINRPKSSGRSSKLIELSEPPVRGMHGDNLKHNSGRRGNKKSEKLIEIDEEHDEDHSSQQDDDYKPHGANRERLHGGNYKSAKLVTPEDRDDDDIRVKSLSKNTRSSAAELLNSFAQAVPILTSTPGYIVDPSKRMYYYVDK